jgi:hypothetical protein
MKRYTVKSSQIEHVETIDEGKFEVELYKCERTFYKPQLRWIFNPSDFYPTKKRTIPFSSAGFNFIETLR